MRYNNIKKMVTVVSACFLLSSCGERRVPASEGGFYYSGIYFGANFLRYYKKGIKDGCTTAKGNYKKSHWLFERKKEYVNGWFLGRNKCRKLLKINKNGDLIL